MISMQHIEQNPKIRKYLPWVTAAIVFSISYPWFLHPLLQTVQADSSKDRIEGLYQERLGRLQSVLIRQKQKWEELIAWKQEHETWLFDPEQADAFFSGLDQTASSFGCRIVSVEYTIQPCPEPDTHNRSSAVYLTEAKIQLTGRYDRWIQFLEWFESLPQCVLIDSLKLESQKDRPGVLIGRIHLAVPVYSERIQSENGSLQNPEEK